MKDGKPFAFAGLYSHWSKEETPIDSCTILTTDANDLVRPLHDRMPVILDPASEASWLERAAFSPFSADRMEAYPVDTWVNSPKHEGPRCIEGA